jgi:hypothetical protein
MGLKTAASFQWGDAQNAMDYWAQHIPARLSQLKSGGETTAQNQIGTRGFGSQSVGIAIWRESL